MEVYFSEKAMKNIATVDLLYISKAFTVRTRTSIYILYAHIWPIMASHIWCQVQHEQRLLT